MQTKTGIIKRIVDVVLTVLLLFLMAFQVTGNVLHEWLGIGMTVTLILHHILNRKWYKAVFKGKYSPYRIVMTAVNLLLLVSIALTALSGMSMSGHAVAFMYGLINVMTARKLHLAMSYWSFIFMGVHIGLHMKAIKPKRQIQMINAMYNYRQGDIHSAEFSYEWDSSAFPLRSRRSMCSTRYWIA